MTIRPCSPYGRGTSVGLTKSKCTNLSVNLHATDVYDSIQWVDPPFERCVGFTDHDTPSLSDHPGGHCHADVPGTYRQPLAQLSSGGNIWYQLEGAVDQDRDQIHRSLASCQ